MTRQQAAAVHALKQLPFGSAEWAGATVIIRALWPDDATWMIEVAQKLTKEQTT